jgi:hypothetical protein
MNTEDDEWVSEIPFITAEEWKKLNETYRPMESQTEGRKVGGQAQRTADERGGTQL